VRVLGVDPGTVRTGWGVVERDGARLHGVAAGVITLRESEPLERRLLTICDALDAVIAAHGPVACAVEDIFFAKYPAAAMKLGHARGAVLVAAARRGLAVSAYPPALVKRAVGGRGAADKAQVARMVGALLGWAELPAIDATDALAIAIAHLHAAQPLGASLVTPGRAARSHTSLSRGSAALPDARVSLRRARAAVADTDARPDDDPRGPAPAPPRPTKRSR
jgi:crossover junction endodeoxyribonuclease RuvC